MNYTLPNDIYGIETDSYAEEISMTADEILEILTNYLAKSEGFQA